MARRYDSLLAVIVQQYWHQPEATGDTLWQYLTLSFVIWPR